MAWRSSPIARSPGAASGTTRAPADRRPHGKSAAQVCLRWLVQQGVAAIPRTSKLERLSENIEIFDFELSEEEMRQISSMASRRRPADRLQFRAEMGLRIAAPDAMLAGTVRRSRYCSDRGGTAAGHTLRHHGIGDRASVASDAGSAVFRGASVRFGDRRADRGRYRDTAGYRRKAASCRTTCRRENAGTGSSANAAPDFSALDRPAAASAPPPSAPLPTAAPPQKQAALATPTCGPAASGRPPQPHRRRAGLHAARARSVDQVSGDARAAAGSVPTCRRHGAVTRPATISTPRRPMRPISPAVGRGIPAASQDLLETAGVAGARPTRSRSSCGCS